MSAHVLAILIIVVTIPSFVPQYLRARTSVEGLDPRTWVGWAVASATWFVYGLTQMDLALVGVNVFTVPLLTAISVRILKAKPEAFARSCAYASVMVGLALLGALADSTALSGATAVAATAWMLTPQLVQTLREPDKVTGMSAATWWFGVTKQSMWIAYGLLIANVWIVANSSFMLVVSAIILVVLHFGADAQRASDRAEVTA